MQSRSLWQDSGKNFCNNKGSSVHFHGSTPAPPDCFFDNHSPAFPKCVRTDKAKQEDGTFRDAEQLHPAVSLPRQNLPAHSGDVSPHLWEARVCADVKPRLQRLPFLISVVPTPLGVLVPDLLRVRGGPQASPDGHH
jgi:hypothetical protein